MFHYMTINVKPRFMVMSLFVTPSQRLIAKVDSVVAPMHCCNKSINPFAPRCPLSQQPTGLQDSLLGQVDTF